MTHTYPGGKNGSGTYQAIINQIPPHDLFIEAFAGSGAILRHKKPAKRTLAFDLDPRACSNLEGAIPGITVINGDSVKELLKHIGVSRFTRSRIFVYADPPYLFSTRKKQGRMYEYEFGEVKEHKQLLKLVKELDAFGIMVAISGYWSFLYEHELHGWRSIQYNAVTRSGAVAREYLWMNYPEPIALHDYRYLGDTYTERQQIKRQVARWKARLERMPLLKRRALEKALEEIKIS